jgi:hypothetical protein
MAPLQMAPSKLPEAKGSASREGRHPGGRFDADDPGTALGQGHGVLPQSSRHIQDAPSRGWTSLRERLLRHTLEQVLAIARGSRGNDIPHVPVQIDDPHGGVP